MQSAAEKCPWCDSPISREKFAEVTARIRAEEKKKLAAAEVQFQRRLEAEKLQFERHTKMAADKEVAAIGRQRDDYARQLKDLKRDQAALLKQTIAEAEKRAGAIVSQGEEQNRKQLAEQRDALQKDRDQALLKKNAEFARERTATQKKILELERQVQRKTANEMGDGAEIDLFETIKGAFPDDRIARIGKGQPGADLLHEIRYKGETCGSIVYDSKNRQAWQHTFVTKLRQDQVEAGADHAILSTTVFPRDKKELCVESRVIIVNPARAVHIAAILREWVIAMHQLGLSVKQRHEKTDKLFRFIGSSAYQQRFNQIANLTDEALKIDAEEKKAHDAVWRRRGTVLTRQNALLREIATEIAAIVEGDETKTSAA